MTTEFVIAGSDPQSMLCVCCYCKRRHGSRIESGMTAKGSGKTAKGVRDGSQGVREDNFNLSFPAPPRNPWRMWLQNLQGNIGGVVVGELI